MDVMVQHHPEYTSLAWGAMKVLFVAVVNQQNLLPRLATGLCHVAEILPRAELILLLYPTAQIKDAIVAMYAHILRFLMRALRWYQESKAKHALHAITRPAELRYDDLLKKILSLSDSLTRFAQVSGQAEQHDIHSKVKQHLSEQKAMQISVEQLTSLVLQMKESIASEQAINASVRIEVRQTLSEIQLVQFMSLLSVADADVELLQDFLSGMINATRKLRFHVKDFCTNSIMMLQKDQIPVIWALKAIDTRGGSESPIRDQVSTIELLKYLISQAIRVNEAIHTDAALIPQLKLYMDAKTEQQWFDILAMALQGLPLIYIIIDVELLNPSLIDLTENFSWPAAFLKVFSELAQRSMRTVVKVLLVSYGSSALKSNLSDYQKLMVNINQHKSARPSYEKPGVLARRRRKMPALGIGRSR
ncbi:hypothetical protein BGZ60DRAFT_530024 [Tricladium varicosporioides]|nr:hypothetical protein BGZ60DRAFT_530024 [Hymenoscyphus varicosporioides]